MSSRPQFNLFTKPSVAAPVTSMQQAAAVQVSPRAVSATSTAHDSSTADPNTTDPSKADNTSIYSPSESASDSEKASDPELSPVQSSTSPRSAADKIHDVKAAHYKDSANNADSEIEPTTNQPEPVLESTQARSDFIAMDDPVPTLNAEDSPSSPTEPETLPSNDFQSSNAAKLSSDDPETSQLESEDDANDSVTEPTHNFDEPINKSVNNSSIPSAEQCQGSPKPLTKFSPGHDYSISIDQLQEVPPESEPFEGVNHPVDTTDAEQHNGALRRHSLQIMKELGPPETPVASGETSTDDSDSVFDYAKFMTHLRSKHADPIARYIKSFLQEFCRGSWTPAQQEKIVADFLRFIAARLREHEPFASMTKKERRNSLEGVEKLIMTRLYTRTFPPSMPPLLRTDGHNEDLLRDQIFAERMRLWGWIEGRHLDINNEYISEESTPANFVQLATRELGRLNQFKSPRDKMICILNCSKVIFALIRQAKLEQNADSFLPLLIYVVIKSQPDHLVSTINYIQRYRNREFQRGETAYYLSTLASAVAFLEQLDKTSLTISDEEFESSMAKSVQAETDRLVAERSHPSHLGNNNHDRPSHNLEGESSAAVLTTSASMLVDRMRKMTTKIWEDFGTDESESLPASGSSNANNQQRQAQLNYRAQTRAAAKASLDEYESAQSQHQQFEESLESLHNMFPHLDMDLIADVLHQNGANLGSAVDLCLALSA